MVGAEAQGLTEGMIDAQPVIMDAANGADPLRAFIADDAGATAHIKRKRFRRIALRCKKTIRSFKAFVDLACAMA